MTDIISYSKKTEHKSALSRAYLHPLWDRNILKHISEFKKTGYMEQGRYREAILQALEIQDYVEVKKIMEISGERLDPNLELQAAGYRGDMKEINRIIENTPKNKLIISRVLIGAAKANNVDILKEFSNQDVNIRLAFEEALKHGNYDAAVYLHSIGGYSPKLFMFIAYSRDQKLKEYFEEIYGMNEEETNDYINGLSWSGYTEESQKMARDMKEQISENDMQYNIGRGGGILDNPVIKPSYLYGLARGGHWDLFQKVDEKDPNFLKRDYVSTIFSEAARENQGTFILKFIEFLKGFRNIQLWSLCTDAYMVATAMNNTNVLKILEQIPCDDGPINRKRKISRYIKTAAVKDNSLVFRTPEFIKMEIGGTSFCKYIDEEDMETVVNHDAVEIFMILWEKCNELFTTRVRNLVWTSSATSIFRFLLKKGEINTPSTKMTIPCANVVKTINE